MPKILTDDKLDDIPRIIRPTMMKYKPKDDNCISVVLSGGYNVQPIPLPNSLQIDSIIQTYEKGIIKIDILLTLGYPTSGEPINIGMKTFPKPPNNPGITRKKIISNP